MDIPFLGSTVGWRNYKIVAKKELGAVPILGTAILAGGHIMVDRSDRRSQLNTLKQGINYLKSNVNLCTFPEGTRSRTGRMMKFKNGAFKMAYKAGAPIVPLSIVNSHKVMPTGWMMAMRPAHGIAEVIVHEPIESKGKTEEELVEAVRKSMMEGLPDDQKPL
jgi:1-acyl-sn-glycerol-3-phosphate acyltransferase